MAAGQAESLKYGIARKGGTAGSREKSLVQRPLTVAVSFRSDQLKAGAESFEEA